MRGDGLKSCQGRFRLDVRKHPSVQGSLGHRRGVKARPMVAWLLSSQACLFSAPARMSVLLLVCLFQASVMWRFIHFQLRRWREYWHEQSSRKRATACAKQPVKPLKRDSGERGVLGNRLPRALWVPHPCSDRRQAGWGCGQPGLWEVTLPMAHG